MRHNRGDMVTIRSYESMREEFGIAISGPDEVLKNGFSIHMSYLCGGTYEITHVTNGEYRIADEVWSISDEMLTVAQGATGERREQVS